MITQKRYIRNFSSMIGYRITDALTLISIKCLSIICCVLWSNFGEVGEVLIRWFSGSCEYFCDTTEDAGATIGERGDFDIDFLLT